MATGLQTAGRKTKRWEKVEKHIQKVLKEEKDMAEKEVSVDIKEERTAEKDIAKAEERKGEKVMGKVTF